MKTYLYIILAFVSVGSNAQNHFNLDDGFIAEGYDVVSYFKNKAEEGKPEFMYTHKGAKLKFISQAHLDQFKANPESFMPQYGGYCAYAIGDNGKKVDINPEYFKIENGKLYLFYKTIFKNTLKCWNKEESKNLKSQADKNWAKILDKK
tara:strand:+ start:691 stop:1137 length:447 start_codon:yes stop_codon:yes gene_type:complete